MQNSAYVIGPFITAQFWLEQTVLVAIGHDSSPGFTYVYNSAPLGDFLGWLL